MTIKFIARLAPVLFSLAAHAANFPDEPVDAIEPGISSGEMRLGAIMGWLDSRTLLVTAEAHAGSRFWERRVMLVDAVTGQTKEAFPRGAVRCTDPVAGTASVLVGSEESQYTANASVPKPETKLFAWNSQTGTLVPKPAPAGWNAVICRVTADSDVQQVINGIGNGYAYLNYEGGYLGGNRMTDEPGVDLVRNGKKIARMPIRPLQVNRADYLPYRGEYLLSPGTFLFGGSMVRTKSEGPVAEYPLLLMTKSGQVSQQRARHLFESPERKMGEGVVYPYAKGMLVNFSGRSSSGGGLYVVSGNTAKRIWCTKSDHSPYRECAAKSLEISPDGCYAAIYSDGSDNPRASYSFHPTLKILPLCEAKAH